MTGWEPNLYAELRELWNSPGESETTHLPPVRPGWHEKDVEAFSRKVFVLSTHRPASGTDKTITLRDIIRNRHHSPSVKADLFRLLSKQLPRFVNENGRIGDIRVDLDFHNKWVENAGSHAAANLRTPTEVARLFHCERGTIPSLVQLGRLQGTRTHHGLRIDDNSARQFGQEYVSLTSQAKRLGTSTLFLMRTCEQNGINMLLVPVVRRAGPQSFIRVTGLASIGQSGSVRSEVTGRHSRRLRI
jgi:hypothetical protein